jgi:calcium-dependent protein kinase
MWSLGIILYQLLTGDFPFNDLDPSYIKKYLENKENNLFTHVSAFPLEAQNLLKSLLSFSSSDRPTAKEAIESKWLKESLSMNFDENTAMPLVVPNLKVSLRINK